MEDASRDDERRLKQSSGLHERGVRGAEPPALGEPREACPKQAEA